MKSFSDVIEAFGGVVQFRDAMHLPDVNARQMKFRDSIPAGYWPKVVREASQRRIDWVTLDALASMAAAKLEASRSKAERAS